jgi:hypothetical protein
MDPALGAYLQRVAAGLARALGPALAGLYLHGSAALAGWSADLAAADRFAAVVLDRFPEADR